MSIGVCCAATIIYFFPNLTLADPMCTFIFSIIVCCTTGPIMKKCILVIMEGSPSDVDTTELLKDIKLCKNVIGIHDFHLW